MKISSQLELTGAFQTVYTVNSHRWLTVTRLLLTNTTSGAKTVQVCFVPNGASPVAANAALWDYSLNANTYLEWGEGIVLPPLTTIKALASAGTAVNLLVCGTEEGQ